MIGLLEWAGLIMLSGIGLGSIFGLWKKETGLSARVGYAVSLGFIVIVLLEFVLLTLLPQSVIQGGLVDGPAFLIILIVCQALFAGGILIDRAAFFRFKMERHDLTLFGIAGALGVFFIAYFSIFPIFPEFDSVDFHQHVASAVFTMNQGVGIGTGISYWGVIYLLALALRLEPSGISLVVVREAMAVLAVLGVFVFYLAGSKLFGKEKGLWVAGVYAFTGFAWYNMIENAGLYPNFYGVLSCLFLMSVTIDLFGAKKVGGFVPLFLLALFDLFFSHYSSFIILLPILLYAATFLKSKTKRSLFVGITVIAPAAFLLLGPFDLFAVLRNFASGSSGPIFQLTPFSALLGKSGEIGTFGYPSLWPVLQYLISEMYVDWAAVPMLLSVPAFAYWAWRERDAKMLLPLSWFAVIFAIAPFNVAAWRFALIAIIPLIVMAAYGLGRMTQRIPFNAKQRWRLGPSGLYGKLGLEKRDRMAPLAIILMLLIVPGSAMGVVNGLPDQAYDPSTFASSQLDVYQAIQWLSEQRCTYHLDDNTTATSVCGYVTPTDWELTYSQELFHFGGYFSCSLIESPDTASYYALQHQARYLVATLRETCSPYPCPSPVTLNIVNSTAGRSLEINATGIGLNGAQALLKVNGTDAGYLSFQNGLARSVIHFPKAGVWTIQAFITPNKPTWISYVIMGTGHDLPHSTVPFSFTSCLPWAWASADLSGARLAFNNSDVKVWDLVKLKA